ncbi:MAG: anti-sigma factor domain-containing protein [Myxococcales bacterium]
MICSEFKELVGAYALDALDPLERAAAEAHLMEPRHEGCLQALERARAATLQLGGAVDDAGVPAHVWERIEMGLGPRRKRSWSAPAGWAAAAVLAVVVLLLLQQQGRLQREGADLRLSVQSATSSAGSSQELARQCAAQLDAERAGSAAAREAIALLERPGSRVVQFGGVGGAVQTAFAVIGDDGKRAILVSTTLAPTPERDYQLWVVPGGRGATPIAAGLVGAPAAGIAVTEFAAQALSAGAAALAVSAEPKGGSPTGTPSEVVLLAKVSG